ncbi:uncharacterized protein LOC143279473 [Babylonia areolata]|uniref:uncharacterized protein LOC143279473 n=1 Tax=Babylonia areolata TaxID=304850 RepID=UPI003FD1A166
MKLLLLLLMTAMFEVAVFGSRFKQKATKEKKRKSEDVIKARKSIGTLKKEQKLILSVSSSINTNEAKLSSRLHEFSVQQSTVIALSENVRQTAEASEENMNKILTNQETILETQKGIESKISKQHWNTRELLDKIETENQLDRVLGNQRKILASVLESEDALCRGFAEVEEAEQKVVDHINELKTDIKENNVAIAQGRANLSAEIWDSGKQTQELVSRILKRQDTIVDRIINIQSSEERKLDKVSAGQEVILTQIKESREAVESDIREAQNNTEQRQDMINHGGMQIEKGLGSVQASQSQTKDLAKKCQEAGDCDLSSVDGALHKMAESEANSKEAIQNALKNIRRQEEEQEIIVNAEKYVIKGAEKLFQQIEEAADFDEVLQPFKPSVKTKLTDINKNIENINECLGSTFSSLDQINVIIEKLAKLGKANVLG